jgi:hypothetical protein
LAAAAAAAVLALAKTAARTMGWKDFIVIGGMEIERGLFDVKCDVDVEIRECCENVVQVWHFRRAGIHKKTLIFLVLVSEKVT